MRHFGQTYGQTLCTSKTKGLSRYHRYTLEPKDAICPIFYALKCALYFFSIGYNITYIFIFIFR